MSVRFVPNQDADKLVTCLRWERGRAGQGGGVLEVEPAGPDAGMGRFSAWFQTVGRLSHRGR